jgi:hypothetical protein
MNGNPQSIAKEIGPIGRDRDTSFRRESVEVRRGAVPRLSRYGHDVGSTMQEQDAERGTTLTARNSSLETYVEQVSSADGF